MKVLVAIPWRPNGDLYRARNRALVEKHFVDLGYEVRCVDSPTEVFNRAAARNACAQWALDHDYGVVVICDADCIPPKDGLFRAIEEAWTFGGLHYPFKTCQYLTHAETEYALAHEEWPEPTRDGYASGGCFVLEPDDWFAAGGMDERLATWGGEDDAFYVATETLLRKPEHHTGVMWHLYHGRQDIEFGTAEHEANLRLLYRYSAASGNPSLMSALFEERSGSDSRPRPTSEVA